MITIRASALGDFFDCPARAEAKHLLGKRTPMGGAALLGKAVHAATAVYDQSVIDGSGITVDEAAAAAVDTIHRPDEEVSLDADESTKEAEGIAIALHRRYCAEIAPRQEYLAVEVTCDRLEITDLGIALTGTTDRVGRNAAGEAGILDIKTGKTAVGADGTVKTAGHAYQLGVYELLAERASGLPIAAPAQIIGLQTGKTERGQRAGISGPVVGARDVLIGDETQPGVLEMVARMIHAGAFPGNPRSMLCGPRFCPIHQSCRFRL
jgi:RecB family exonuclease